MVAGIAGLTRNIFHLPAVRKSIVAFVRTEIPIQLRITNYELLPASAVRPQSDVIRNF
jgi:hypothetical protein